MYNKIFLDTNIFIDLLIDVNKASLFDKIRNNIDNVNSTKKVLKEYLNNGNTLFIISSSSLMNTFFILNNKQKIQAKHI